MNKLFNKIAAGVVGIAMAIGVGVALQTNTNLTKTKKVAASYDSVTTLSAGDEIVIAYVNGNTKVELSGISTTSTKYGVPANFTNDPAGTFSFTVEAGTSTGSYAFKNGTNYLYWTSGNSLNVNSTKSANTSWTIVVDSSDNTKVRLRNVADNSRYLQYNSASSGLRFACYANTTNQALTIFKNSSASSASVTFTPGIDTGSTSVTKQGITATMSTMNNASYYQIYANSSATFTSAGGNILKIEFACTASGTAKYGPGNTTADVGTYSFSGANGKWLGDNDTVTLTSTAQVRMTTLTITYASSGAVSPTGIACSAKSISVCESVNLANAVTFTPTDTTETGLSFTIKSGSDKIDLDTTTGVVTGKKGGNAVVTITPSDTTAGAQAIDVAITVSSIAAPGVTIGDQYIIYSTNNNDTYAMTGVSSNLGTAALYTSEVPTATYVLTIEQGYYENTVAFKNGSSYLSLTTASNNLNTTNSVTANSSWIVTWNSSTHEAVATNGLFGRQLQFNYNSGSPRFACYGSTQTAISLYPYHFKALEDIVITDELEIYEHQSAQIEVIYDPEDTTQTTLSWESDDEDVATVSNTGLVTGVGEGMCTITAWFDANEDGTLNSGEISATCDVYVYAFVATHTLVTNKSQLVNGAKVIIASNDSNYDKVSGQYSDNNVHATDAAFDRINDGLYVYGSSYKEFTVWNIDGHIVLSSAGYYLAVTNSKGNNLKHYDRLSENCYFDVTNSSDGVAITSTYSLNWEDVEDPYTLKYNNNSNVFSVYASGQKDATLYISVEAVNVVQGFVDVFMHLDNVPTSTTSDTNACRDEGSGAKSYFATALSVFNNDLTEAQRETFVSDYDDAFDRLSAWAVANGYDWDSNDMTLVASSRIAGLGNDAIESSGPTLAIIVASILSLTAVGGYFVIRKRKFTK